MISSYRRIAIDGAQCSGKTTLLGELSRRLGGEYALIPEAARVIAPQFGVTSLSDWPRLLEDHQELARFFHEELCWLSVQQTTSATFLCDSSHFVVEAYRRTLLGHELPLSDATLSSSYNMVLYCEPVELESDGFRFFEKRDSVIEQYSQVLNEAFSGRVERLLPGPNRCDYVIDLLQI